MRCVGHVVHMGTKQNTCSDLVVGLKEEDNLEDMGMGRWVYNITISIKIRMEETGL